MKKNKKNNRHFCRHCGRPIRMSGFIVWHWKHEHNKRYVCGKQGMKNAQPAQGAIAIWHEKEQK